MAWNLVNDENFAFAEGIRKGIGEAGKDAYTITNNPFIGSYDYNNMTNAGIYMMPSNASNAPVSAFSLLIVLKNTEVLTNEVFQLCFPLSGSGQRVYVRDKDNSDYWDNWQ